MSDATHTNPTEAELEARMAAELEATEAAERQAASSDGTIGGDARVADPNPAGGAPPELRELASPEGVPDPSSLTLLYDLTMPVAIELGRTRMSVQELLALGRGSVVQLDRLAGEPIDVFVGDRRFAEGEVVVVGEQFGVRITRILSSQPSSEGEAVA